MEFTLRICSQCSANSRGDPCADLWSTFHAKFPPFQNSALNFQLPQPPQASSSTSSIQRGPAVFPSLLLCSAKKPGQSEGHLSCFSSPRVHSPVPPVPQSLKTVDSQSSAWKQSVPFSSCLWWEVKFNPYYSQIVQPEWEQCKYHGLICLVSECPSELCERRPDSPALLVCLGVLGLLRAEVHLCLKRCIFIQYGPTVNGFMWCSFEEQRSVLAGGRSARLDFLRYGMLFSSGADFPRTIFTLGNFYIMGWC